jgi:hypothetical protein
MNSILRQLRRARPSEPAVADTGERPSGWAAERLWLMIRYALEDIGEAELLGSADVAESDAAVGGYEVFTGRTHEPLAALICRCGDLRLRIVTYGESYPALKAVLVDEEDRQLCGTEPFRLPAFHWTTGSWERPGKPMRPRQRRAYRDSVRHQYLALTNAVQAWHATWQAWGVTSNDEAIVYTERVALEAAASEAAQRALEEERRRDAERRRAQEEALAVRERLRLYLSAGVTPPDELVRAAERTDEAVDPAPGSLSA